MKDNWCSVCQQRLNKYRVGDELYRADYEWGTIDHFGPVVECIRDCGASRDIWVKFVHDEGDPVRIARWTTHHFRWNNESLTRRDPNSNQPGNPDSY